MRLVYFIAVCSFKHLWFPSDKTCGQGRHPRQAAEDNVMRMNIGNHSSRLDGRQPGFWYGDNDPKAVMQRQAHRESFGGHQYKTPIYRSTNLVIVSFELCCNPKYTIWRGLFSNGSQCRGSPRHIGGCRRAKPTAHRYFGIDCQRKWTVTNCMPSRQ
jgi:hypothetical protein